MNELARGPCGLRRHSPRLNKGHFQFSTEQWPHFLSLPHCRDFTNTNVILKEVCLAIWVLEQHGHSDQKEFPQIFTLFHPSPPGLLSPNQLVLHPKGAGCTGQELVQRLGFPGHPKSSAPLFITSQPAESHTLLDNLGYVYRSGHPSRYTGCCSSSQPPRGWWGSKTWNLKTWTLLLVHLFIQQTLRANWVQALSGGRFLILGPPSKAALSVEGTQEAIGEDQLIY